MYIHVITVCTAGMDFEIIGTMRLTLSPDEPSVLVPFSVLDDNIAELSETFNIFLFIPEDSAVYTLDTPSTTVITITDDEGIIIWKTIIMH